MSHSTPRILIVAGSDSGGGAGIQADIKTVTMLGGHATTAITAITAQNTLGVTAVHPIPTDMVLAQIDAVLADIGADAVKIGMIGSAETAMAVAERLEALPGVPVVFDPVMVATSGSLLADAATVAAFERLMRLATVVTPNVPELAALVGEEKDGPSTSLSRAQSRGSGRTAGKLSPQTPVRAEPLGIARDRPVEAPSFSSPEVARREASARALAARTHATILAKGGDAEGDTLTDILVTPAGEVTRWQSTRLDSPHTHGTGCTLASAIAVGLAQALPLADAIARAGLFVRLAIREAPGFGAGHGPMGHQAVRFDVPMAGPTPNQITLPFADFAASYAFYRALGFTAVVEAAPRYARFQAPGGLTLSIEAADEIAGPTLFLECADLDAAVGRLRAAGHDVGDPITESWGWREARLTDPAGNPLRLYHAGENRRFPPWRVDA